MMMKLTAVLKIAFLTVLLIISFTCPACTIFMANDGQHVWIGNNEDEVQNLRYRFWYYPAERSDYGYAIWTELSFGKLLNGFSYLNPQGGLNEQGLFLDFTAIDEIQVVKEKKKTDRRKQVVTDILRKCKTVDEALAYLNQYNLVRLNKAQLFIGDATGNYVTVTGGYIVRKTANNFALTNYCINNGHTEACYRRDVATQYLRSGNTIELDEVKSVLEKSAQKFPNNLVSNYSMAVNLKTSTIYLYYKTDFTTKAVISLPEEIKKGKHHIDMSDYFPESITPVLEKEFERKGIAAAIANYQWLRKNSFTRYNFTNSDAMNLAIDWIAKGKNNEAIQLLECLIQFDGQHADLYSWLGVAYRKGNKLIDSRNNFEKAFRLDPDNYVAVLFGNQTNQRVTFKLADFEGAEQVYLMGEFSGWTRHPVKMKKEPGFWSCEIALPKGAVAYKFVVNKEYLADSKNYLHTGSGPNVYSTVFVW